MQNATKVVFFYFMVNADVLSANRTPETAVDHQDFKSLLRWLTFIATQGRHYSVFAQKDVPQFTWHTRRNEDDVLLGMNAFPTHPTKGATHIQLFTEGHPMYAPFGINALLGIRDEEGSMRLLILSTNGENDWANEYYTGEPIDVEGFRQLAQDFGELSPQPHDEEQF